MGDFSRLNKFIELNEKRMKFEKEEEEARLEAYFAKMEKKRVSRIPLSEMSWNDADSLYNIKKSATNNPDVNSDEYSIKELDQEINNIILKIVHIRPDLLDDFNKVADLLNVIRNPGIKKCNKKYLVSLKKNLVIKKSNEGITVSGFAMSASVDKQNDRIPISAIKSSWDDYMKTNRSLNEAHSNRVIGEVTKGEWKKTPTGSDGLFITAKIYNVPQNSDIIEKLKNGYFKDFSIAGLGIDDAVSQKCDTSRCWREVGKMNVYEVSLVPEGANGESHINTIKGI